MTTGFNIKSLRNRLEPTDQIFESADDRPDAAVAVIIDSSHSNGSLLLIQRTERIADPWSGQVAFPGGRRARDDRSLLETAIRETEEEVGISLRDHSLLGALPVVYARTRRVKVAPFVFELKTSVEVRPNVEVANVFWVSVNDLALSKPVRSKVDVDQRELIVDSYVYEEHIIWGLTLRIIKILLGVNES